MGMYANYCSFKRIRENVREFSEIQAYLREFTRAEKNSSRFMRTYIG